MFLHFPVTQDKKYIMYCLKKKQKHHQSIIIISVTSELLVQTVNLHIRDLIGRRIM